MGLSDKIEEKEKRIEKKDIRESKETKKSEQNDLAEQNVKTSESDAGIMRDFNSGEKGYQTEMDSMYNLVKSAKHIKLKEVAKMLSISNERAEEWAEILTRHKLITIHYPPIGPIELRAAGYHPARKGIIGKIKNIF